jgi:hypothetical protein
VVSENGVVEAICDRVTPPVSPSQNGSSRPGASPSSIVVDQSHIKVLGVGENAPPHAGGPTAAKNGGQHICYAMLCYAMLCYALLCYAMLGRNGGPNGDAAAVHEVVARVGKKRSSSTMADLTSATSDLSVLQGIPALAEAASPTSSTTNSPTPLLKPKRAHIVDEMTPLTPTQEHDVWSCEEEDAPKREGPVT